MSRDPPILSTAQLIASAQAAVAEGRLGLQRGAVEPLFVAEDGSVCAIGAALPANVLQAILRGGHQGCSWLDIARRGYFTYDDLDTVEALAALQLDYDACFRHGSVDRPSAGRYCATLLSFDPYAPPTPFAWPNVFVAEAEPRGTRPAAPSGLSRPCRTARQRTLDPQYRTLRHCDPKQGATRDATNRTLSDGTVKSALILGQG